MPYKANKNLPDAVKFNMPAAAQNIWREVFNSVYKQLKEKGVSAKEKDKKSAQAAWSRISKYYKKDDRGNWVKKK